MTSQQYQMNLFEESEVWTLSVEDFRAKLSQLQETDGFKTGKLSNSNFKATRCT